MRSGDFGRVLGQALGRMNLPAQRIRGVPRRVVLQARTRAVMTRGRFDGRVVGEHFAERHERGPVEVPPGAA